MSAEAIGVGIVGLSAGGGWAASAHVPALAALDSFELRGVAASSADSAVAAGRQYSVPLAFASARELAEHDQIGLVVVVVKDLAPPGAGPHGARGRQDGLLRVAIRKEPGGG